MSPLETLNARMPQMVGKPSFGLSPRTLEWIQAGIQTGDNLNFSVLLILLLFINPLEVLQSTPLRPNQKRTNQPEHSRQIHRATNPSQSKYIFSLLLLLPRCIDSLDKASKPEWSIISKGLSQAYWHVAFEKASLNLSNYFWPFNLVRRWWCGRKGSFDASIKNVWGNKRACK